MFEEPGDRKAPLVLVALEDAAMRERARESLEAAGYEFVESCDGHDAVSAVERLRPDVAILDAGLPGLDGHSACEAIRRVDDVTPIVLTTDSERKESIDRAYESIRRIGHRSLGRSTLHCAPAAPSPWSTAWCSPGVRSATSDSVGRSSSMTVARASRWRAPSRT